MLAELQSAVGVEGTLKKSFINLFRGEFFIKKLMKTVQLGAVHTCMIYLSKQLKKYENVG